MYKHPKALLFLFFTEMWERFSFYGMRALLTLYLTLQLFKDLQDPQKKATAYGIFAAYGALVYATPFIGGFLADKFLGNKKAILWGAILMAIGHFIMAIETPLALYIALGFIIIGCGFFKPNISTMIGDLYDDRDPRRDSGFTIFYMGINLGGFISPLICGVIGEVYGWHYGFGLAGIGMIFGLIIFVIGKKTLNFKEKIVEDNNEEKIILVPHKIGEPNYPERLKHKSFLGISNEYLIYILSILSVGAFAFLIKNYELMSYVLTPFSILVLGYLFITALRSNKIERDRIFVILILIVANTLFWAFFEQMGTSLNLYANENVNRNFFDWLIPTTVFQSVNSFFIIALGLPISFLWMWLAQKKREPSTPQKFSLAMLLLSIGFLILGIGPHFMAETTIMYTSNNTNWALQIASVPMILLILSYLFQTIGELFQSPVGLSMITKLASPKIVGMVMGAWMLSWSLSHHFAGIISMYTAQPQTTNDIIHKKFKEVISDSLFTIPAKEFTERYQSQISEALEQGHLVILEEGKQITSSPNAVKSFNLTRIIDSTMMSFSRDTLMDMKTIQNKAAFIYTLKTSYSAGISHMLESGDKAIETALKEEYISTHEAKDYSVATKYSLSNLLQYTHVFYMIGIVAFFASLLLFGFSPFIKKMMHGA